jgi:AcrR family transcriptional regulator
VPDNAESSTARRVPSGDRADGKRRAIVAAAREVFLREGYEAAVEGIAAHADVSKVTVYNHFGTKEGLFTAVVGDALDEALGATIDQAEARLASTDDVRDALVATARALVDGVTEPTVLRLRNLVTGELPRFPELGQAWQERGPGRLTPIIADVLERRCERGELQIPNLTLAVLQLYSLTLYPHLVFNSFGSRLDPALTDALIERGVDMFLGYYQARRGPGDSANAA